MDKLNELSNKQFIDTLQVCKDLTELERADIEQLYKSSLDMRGLYKRLSKINCYESTKILKVISHLDKGYSLREEKEKFLETFLKIVELRNKMGIGYDGIGKLLELNGSLNLLRVIELYPSKKLKIFGEVYKFSATCIGRGLVYKILINDRDCGNIGGVFINNDNLEFVRVDDATSYKKLIHRIMHDRYELVVVPSFNYIVKDLEDVVDTSNMENSEYLEYILLFKDTDIEKVDTKTYWKIYDSKIRYAKIIDLLRRSGVTNNTWLKFLTEFDDRIQREKREKEVGVESGVRSIGEELRLEFLKKFASRIEKDTESKIIDDIYNILMENFDEHYISNGVKIEKL